MRFNKSETLAHAARLPGTTRHRHTYATDDNAVDNLSAHRECRTVQQPFADVVEEEVLESITGERINSKNAS